MNDILRRLIKITAEQLQLTYDLTIERAKLGEIPADKRGRSSQYAKVWEMENRFKDNQTKLTTLANDPAIA